MNKDAILDDYSQRIADAIFERWPEWKSLTQVKTEEKSSTGYLELIIPATNPNLKEGLWVTTDNEVIVGFDYYHSHLDGLGKNNPMLARWMVDLIGSILADKLLAVSWWINDHFCAGGASEPNIYIPKSPFVNGEALCRIRSWSGKYDKEIKYH